jgi:hypothetical protein
MAKPFFRRLAIRRDGTTRTRNFGNRRAAGRHPLSRPQNGALMAAK